MEAVNHKIYSIRVKRKFFNYNIINAHASTKDKPPNKKEEFYEDLENTYRQCSKNDIKIVVRNMNAKVGQEQIFNPTIGKNSFHRKSSDNRIRLVNFAASLNMTITSTWFQHKNIHKTTWITPDGQCGNQIDYLLIDTKQRSNVMDCQSYRGGYIDSDHYLVIAKLQARISQARKKRGEKKSKLKVEKLKNLAKAERMHDIINSRLEEAAQDTTEVGDINNYWNRLKKEVHTVTKKVVEKQQHVRRRDWYDGECLEVTRLKNEAYLRMQTQQTRTAIDEYQAKRRNEKKIHKAKRKVYFNQQLRDIEALNKQHEYREINNCRRSF